MSDSALKELEVAVAAAETAAAAPVTMITGREARRALELSERLRRVAAAAMDAIVDEIDRTYLFRDPGFSTAKAMVEYEACLSPGEASRINQRRRLLAGCDQIRLAWAAGELSVDQAGVLARGYANPRTRELFIETQNWFLEQARRCNYRQFELLVGRWVRLADADGPEPADEPGHRDRDVSLVQDTFSLQWTLRGTFGSAQGAQIKQVIDAYTEAEFTAEWERAIAEHGHGVAVADLDRSSAQRRADGFVQAMIDGLANDNGSGPIETVHNIVWSASSFEEFMRRLAGGDAEPLDPRTHRCHTLDGHPLDPQAAIADAFVGSVRRIIQDAASVTINMGTKQRLFMGLARLGVQLSSDTCYWPGCNRPTSQSQVDHLTSAAMGGPTSQFNGLPACRRHNQLKERGYTVTRDADTGSIEITTPEGDRLTTHPQDE